jgi:hypothetical protein
MGWINPEVTHQNHLIRVRCHDVIHQQFAAYYLGPLESVGPSSLGEDSVGTEHDQCSAGEVGANCSATNRSLGSVRANPGKRHVDGCVPPHHAR